MAKAGAHFDQLSIPHLIRRQVRGRSGLKVDISCGLDRGSLFIRFTIRIYKRFSLRSAVCIRKTDEGSLKTAKIADAEWEEPFTLLEYGIYFIHLQLRTIL